MSAPKYESPHTRHTRGRSGGRPAPEPRLARLARAAARVVRARPAAARTRTRPPRRAGTGRPPRYDPTRPKTAATAPPPRSRAGAAAAAGCRSRRSRRSWASRAASSRRRARATARRCGTVARRDRHREPAAPRSATRDRHAGRPALERGPGEAGRALVVRARRRVTAPAGSAGEASPLRRARRLSRSSARQDARASRLVRDPSARASNPTSGASRTRAGPTQGARTRWNTDFTSSSITAVTTCPRRCSSIDFCRSSPVLSFESLVQNFHKDVHIYIPSAATLNVKHQTRHSLKF